MRTGYTASIHHEAVAARVTLNAFYLTGAEFPPWNSRVRGLNENYALIIPFWFSSLKTLSCYS